MRPWVALQIGKTRQGRRDQFESVALFEGPTTSTTTARNRDSHRGRIGPAIPIRNGVGERIGSCEQGSKTDLGTAIHNGGRAPARSADAGNGQCVTIGIGVIVQHRDRHLVGRRHRCTVIDGIGRVVARDDGYGDRSRIATAITVRDGVAKCSGPGRSRGCIADAGSATRNRCGADIRRRDTGDRQRVAINIGIVRQNRDRDDLGSEGWATQR